MTINDIGPKPQSFDIERATKENTNYRSVAWSGRYLQATLMSIPAGGDIGLEAHPETDQFLRLDIRRRRCLGLRFNAAGGIALGDQAHREAALEQFGFANVLSAGENSALGEDEEDVHASHAAEDALRVGDALHQGMPAATQTAKVALRAAHLLGLLPVSWWSASALTGLPRSST